MPFLDTMHSLPHEIKCLIVLLCGFPVSVVFNIRNFLMLFIPTSFMHKDISGKVVLVTGGAGSIGRGIAVGLAKKGALIVSWDMNKSANEETARIITENGGDCATYTVDMSNKEAVYSTASLVKKDIGPIDILINNAGIIGSKEMSLCTNDESFAKTMDINFFSHTWTVNSFLPDMISANSGHIVSIASLCGLSAHHFIEYSTSKFAAAGYIESLRVQLSILGHNGIVASCMCPSFVDTPLITDEFGEVDKMKIGDATDQLIDAILREKDFCIIPTFAKMMPLLKATTPTSVWTRQYTSLTWATKMKKIT